ncbi:hypothetical protein HS7_03610 [Sulfolobales archaeon HS-7]|nr:hypothetical protein HS7_03610 [Sulfolobales archaeon HS-7]
MHSSVSLLTSFLILLLSFVIVLIIISMPVYFASKMISKRSSLTRAIIASIGGLTIYFILRVITSPLPFVFSFVLAFLGLLFIFKITFETSWIGALGIAFLSLVFVIIVTTAVIFILISLGLIAPHLARLIPFFPL